MMSFPFTFTITSLRAALDQYEVHLRNTNKMLKKKSVMKGKLSFCCAGTSTLVILALLTNVVVKSVMGETSSGWSSSVIALTNMIIPISAIACVFLLFFIGFIQREIEKIVKNEAETLKIWGVEEQPKLVFSPNDFDETFTVFLVFPNHGKQYVGIIPFNDEMSARFIKERSK